MTVDDELIPFKNRMNELTIEQGCILWGIRVIIPTKLRQLVLQELHETHAGSTKMKSIARSYVWWPNLDRNIEELSSACIVCQSMRSDPPKAPVHPWTFPATAWSRLHVDFAGPVQGRTYLVLVDAYSKYPEIMKMNSTTSQATVHVLRDIFSRQGLPEVIVSDNGPQFVAHEFQKFCQENGIVHRTSAVYKPATNGQAERVVQILKSAIKQSQLTKTDVDTVIARYFLRYRTTPHSSTGEAPSVLLMGRRLRTRLDLMKPSVGKVVERKQEYVASKQANRHCRTFQVGDAVFMRNYSVSYDVQRKWIRGVVHEVLGERHYLIDIGESVKHKRHIDQLISRSLDGFYQSNEHQEPKNGPYQATIEHGDSSDEDQNRQVNSRINTPSNSGPGDVANPTAVDPVPNDPDPSTDESDIRYPQRNRTRPSYLRDFVAK